MHTYNCWLGQGEKAILISASNLSEAINKASIFFKVEHKYINLYQIEKKITQHKRKKSTLAVDFVSSIPTNRPITHAELIIVDLLKAIDILIDDSRKSPLVESKILVT